MEALYRNVKLLIKVAKKLDGVAPLVYRPFVPYHRLFKCEYLEGGSISLAWPWTGGGGRSRGRRRERGSMARGRHRACSGNRYI